MTVDSIVARAAPPPDRAQDGVFEPVETPAASLARREEGLVAAFGSKRELARHAEELGLSADAYLKRFHDVRLVGSMPDWGNAFSGVLDRLEDTATPFSAVYRWAREGVEAEWPAGLPRRAVALDGPIRHLEHRFRSVLMSSMIFEARLNTGPVTWRRRFERSPALAYALGRVMADWRADLLQMLGHAARDRAEIAARVLDGADPGELCAVEPGLGDPHAGGRSVAILRFANGSVVFKPKDLRIAAAVGQIAGMLRSVNLQPPAVTVRQGYAWEKEHSPGPVADAAEADAFYRSLGGWLALLQSMNAADFWFDNLIADGATPRFIDFETALQPPLDWPVGIRPLTDSGAAGFAMNVTGVGILPLLMPIREGVEATDLGCLSRPGEHVTPLTDPTDGSLAAWHMDAFAPRYMDGQHADAASHFDAFEDGYLRIARELGSAETGARIVETLRSAGDAALRVIRIDTWTCYRIIRAALRPPALADGVWREIALHRPLVGRTDLTGPLREAAVRDMRRLDIPLFSTSPNSRDLRGVEGELRKEAFSLDAIAGVRRALGAMAETVDADRVAWLRSAFSLRPGNPRRRRRSSRPYSPATAGDLLSWADEIATQVRDGAIVNASGYPTWIGLSHDVHWGMRFIAPLSIDVLSGRAGLATALLELGDGLGRPDLTTLAREALRGAALDYIDYNDAHPYLGAGYAVGVGGLLDALARRPETREEAERVYQAVCESEAWMRSGNDFVSGLAGLRDAVLAIGATPPTCHGPERAYVPSALPRLARWLDPDNAPPLCADRRAAAGMRRHRDRYGNWFAERWADDRHNLSGIDGLPALAVAFAALAEDDTTPV